MHFSYSMSIPWRLWQTCSALVACMYRGNLQPQLLIWDHHGSQVIFMISQSRIVQRLITLYTNSKVNSVILLRNNTTAYTEPQWKIFPNGDRINATNQVRIHRQPDDLTSQSQNNFINNYSIYQAQFVFLALSRANKNIKL